MGMLENDWNYDRHMEAQARREAEQRRKEEARQRRIATEALNAIFNRRHLDTQTIALNIQSFSEISQYLQERVLGEYPFPKASDHLFQRLSEPQQNKKTCQRIFAMYLLQSFSVSSAITPNQLKKLWSFGMQNESVVRDCGYHPKFINTINVFLGKLISASTPLTVPQKECLQAIIMYYYDPSTHVCSFNNPLIKKLLSCVDGHVRENPLASTFNERVQTCIQLGFIPYMRVMDPKTLSEILATGNVQPIINFIMEYTDLLPFWSKSVRRNTIYAPQGKITVAGIQKYLSYIFDWSLIFGQDTLTLRAINVTPVANTVTIKQAIKTWDNQIKNLFHWVTHNRSLLLECMQMCQNFCTAAGNAPDSLAVLAEALAAIDEEKETCYAVKIQDESELFTSLHPNPSYRILLESVVFFIERCLLSQIKAHPERHEFLGSANIKEQILRGISTEIKSIPLLKELFALPIANFMQFIETHYEKRMNLLCDNAMESGSVRKDIAIDNPFDQTAHYDEVNYYIKIENRVSHVQNNAAYEVVRRIIARNSGHTIKEILLCAQVFGTLQNELSAENKAQLIRKFPQMLHNFFVFQRIQKLDRSLKVSLETPLDNFIQQIFEIMVKKAPSLVLAYVKLMALKRGRREEVESDFFQNYQESITKLMQDNGIPLRSLYAQLIPESLSSDNGFQTRTCFSPRVHTAAQDILEFKEYPQTTKWEPFDQGSFNVVYQNADKTLVFRAIHSTIPVDQKIESAARTARLWTKINPNILPAPHEAKVYTENMEEWGLVVPYIPGDQSDDEEMQNAVIDIFNRTGRIVVDATSERNFLTVNRGTPEQQVICVDVAYALDFDEKSTNLQGGSMSLPGWGNLEKNMPALFERDSARYPKTVQTVKALLFIKLCLPNIRDTHFFQSLPSNAILMQQLAQAYDHMQAIQNNESANIVSETVEKVSFAYAKNYYLSQFIDLEQKISQKTGNYAGRFWSSESSSQALNTIIQLKQKLEVVQNLYEGHKLIQDLFESVEASQATLKKVLNDCLNETRALNDYVSKQMSYSDGEALQLTRY